MAEHMLITAGSAQVGTLGFDSRQDEFEFSYAPGWLAHPQRFPLSPFFPLDGPPAAPATVRRFLDNLMPEGRPLRIAAQHLKISEQNIVGLLIELGRETTGALSFQLDNVAPTEPVPMREITRDELAQRIAQRAWIEFAIWDGKVRLSTAGVQDKLAVHRIDDALFLPDDGHPSTHILKPESEDPRTTHLVANEFCCMRLASAMGLAAAPVEILRLPEPVLMVQRFDRHKHEGEIRKVHTIDACQALDLPVTYKYERIYGASRDVAHLRDGVSVARLASMADTSALAPAQYLRSMLQWVFFQFLIGNSDAHGKNLSFFCTAQGLHMTPWYDLVSVAQYPHFDQEMAMAIGDVFEFDAIRPFDVADMAARLAMPRNALARLMTSLATKAQRALPHLVQAPELVADERLMAESIAGLVRTRSERLMQLAHDMPQVSEDPL
ncbi:HipA domain-containing protein [Bordetella sp. BOR01]|uniref:HipA domain-containing protein n=1 Tax=Bordetella sp. BOR01 TaxID=2854779 RepID=UPI001C44F54D|nr:HipA domain-containing protein [Bordetella sp. BOR01]MBV7485513.1 HipA domain-containing protein [Bordetella sp. BOR01]